MPSKEKLLQQKDKLLFWYSYSVIFPVLFLVTNFSLYLFIFTWRAFTRITKSPLSLRSTEATLICFFLIGIILSALDVWTFNQGFSRIRNALSVLPNYIYWGLIVIMFSTNYRLISFPVVARAAFWGLLSASVYFFIPQLQQLSQLYLFKGIADNIFAFLLIAFSPLGLYYARNRWGNGAFTLFGIASIFTAFLGGSRSGSLLVTLNFAVLWIYYNRNSPIIYFMAILGAIFVISFVSFQSQIASFVYDLNPRTHALLFEKNTLEEDHSYLTRLALREKGLYLFSESPVTGVGVNNFSSLQGEIEYNFIGGDIVARDDETIQHSSAHNSYVSILAETGLLGSIPLAIFIVVIFIKALKRALRGDEWSFILLTGLIGMLIHFNFISAILNVFTWFYFGLIVANNERTK